MKKQNYSNHIRYYAPHHFIFLPMMMAAVVVGIIYAITDEAHRLEWILFAFLSFSILYLAFMVRQHYALGNQDRIVRLEFRLRCYELLNKQYADMEKKLSFSQIAALRFADDAEFVLLLDRAMREKLSAKTIKQTIQNWQADNMRV